MDRKMLWLGGAVAAGVGVAAGIVLLRGGDERVPDKGRIEFVATTRQNVTARSLASGPAAAAETRPAAATPPVGTTAVSAPASAPASAPVVAMAVRAGDEILDAERRWRRVEKPGGTYDTFDDSRDEWVFREGSGRVAKRPRPAGMVMGDAALAEARMKPGATELKASEVKWPEVGNLELVNPLMVMEDRVASANTGFEQTVGAVLVSVNRVVQAEDGTFFVVCSERWKEGNAGELPVLELRAAAGTTGRWSAGEVGRIELPGRRIVLALVVPAKSVAGDRTALFELAVGAAAKPEEQVRVEMKAEEGEAHLRACVEGFYGLLMEVDGMAPVWVEEWTLPPGGKPLAGKERPLGDWTAEEFAGQLLGQIADRRGAGG